MESLFTDGKIEVMETEKSLENVHDISKYFGIERFNVIKVMVLRNKYSGNTIACVFTGGSRVDKRTLVALDEGGTKAWKYIPNSELEEVCGYPAGGICPVGLSETVSAIYIDPRVIRKEFVIFPLGTSRRFGRGRPEVILEDDRIEIRPISMG